LGLAKISAATPFARPESLPHRLAAWLREDILDGRLEPGVRLVESELVLRSGTSRVPLREAFRILAQDGLLDLSPHRGASVRPLSDRELRELFGVRAAIEAFAAGVAARRGDAAVIAALRDLVRRMRQAVLGEDTASYGRLAAEFHETLVAAGDNAILAGMYAQIRARLRRYQSAMSRVPHLPQTSIAEHEAIIAAVAAGDDAAAIALTHAHLDSLVGQFAALPAASGSRKAKGRKTI
jgi:DNA-binding GntR family transcriptional regulator